MGHGVLVSTSLILSSVFDMPLALSIRLSLSRPFFIPRSVVMADPTDMEVVRNETLPVNATTMTNERPYPSLSTEVRASLAMAFGKSLCPAFYNTSLECLP